jgi:hypothetical protein
MAIRATAKTPFNGLQFDVLSLKSSPLRPRHAAHLTIPVSAAGTVAHLIAPSEHMSMIGWLSFAGQLHSSRPPTVEN